MSNIEAIKRKIVALSERTTERGFSEAEAMIAASMLQDLMIEHGVTLDEARAARKGGFKLFMCLYSQDPDQVWHEASYVTPALDIFFDVESAEIPLPRGGKTVAIVGFEADCLPAMALYRFIRLAMDAEYAAYLADPEVAEVNQNISEALVRSNFMIGMAERIGERLRAMKAAPKGECKELVVIKKETIEQAMADAGMKEVGRDMALFQPGAEAYKSGRDAGDKVALTPTVDETKKIGSGPKKIWVEDDNVEMFLAEDGMYSDNGSGDTPMYFDSVEDAKKYLREMAEGEDGEIDEEFYFDWLEGVKFHGA